MMATQDIVIKQGDDFAAVFELRQPDGAPVDLTGFTARAQMRWAAESVALVAEFVVGIPGPTTQGGVAMALTSAQTALLSAGRYVYDMLLESNGGIVEKISGAVVVEGRVYAMARRRR